MIIEDCLAIYMSSEEILSVSLSRPEDLFCVPKEDVSDLYYNLLKIWDTNKKSDKDAKKVVAHIDKLYNLAGVMLRNNVWRYEPSKVFNSLDGIPFRVSWKKSFRDYFSNCYIDSSNVTYEIKHKHYKFLKNAEEMISGLKYKDDSMRNQISPLMPSVVSRLKTKDSYIFVLKKRKDSIRLKDLREYLGGRFDIEHVTWIISGLLNIVCYLEWAGITHNTISEEDIYVCPSDHSVSLIGGWFYARPVDSSFLGLPYRSIDYAPSVVLRNKLTEISLDLCLIKRLFVELLGCHDSKDLSRRLSSYSLFSQWLYGNNLKAFDVYQSWFDTLVKVFGKRRFVQLNVTPDQVYP